MIQTIAIFNEKFHRIFEFKFLKNFKFLTTPNLMLNLI